jgi:hypothetical protein
LLASLTIGKQANCSLNQRKHRHRQSDCYYSLTRKTAGASVRDVLSLVKRIANRVGFVGLQKSEEQDKPAPFERY